MPNQTQSALAKTTQMRDVSSDDHYDSQDSGEWIALVEHSSDEDTDSDIPALFPKPNKSALHAAPLDDMKAILRELTSPSNESNLSQSHINRSSEPVTNNVSIAASPASFPDPSVIARHADTLEELKSDLSELPRPSNESELPKFEYYLHLFLPMQERMEFQKSPDHLFLSKMCAMLIRERLSDNLAKKYIWPADLDALLDCIHSRSPARRFPSGDFESTVFPRRTKTEDLEDYLWRVRMWCVTYFTQINSYPPAVQSFAQQMWFSHCALYPEIVDSKDFATAVNEFQTLPDVFFWFRSQPGLRQSLVETSKNASQRPHRSNTGADLSSVNVSLQTPPGPQRSQVGSKRSKSNRRKKNNDQPKTDKGNKGDKNTATKAVKQERTSKTKEADKKQSKQSNKRNSLRKSTKIKGGNESSTFPANTKSRQDSERHFASMLILLPTSNASDFKYPSDWLYSNCTTICCTPHLSDLQHPVPVNDCIIESNSGEELKATHAGYATFTFPSVASSARTLNVVARVLYAPRIACRIFSTSVLVVDNRPLQSFAKAGYWYVYDPSLSEEAYQVAKNAPAGPMSRLPYVDSKLVNCHQVDPSGNPIDQK